MRQRAYTPHTVLAGGIARLGDALPANPFKPTQPDKTMPNPTKPSKPAKVKTPPKDEDYSTPYAPPVFPLAPKQQPVPPVAPPVVNDSLTTAQTASVPELDGIVIEDDVALPQRKNPKYLIMQTLIEHLQPGQSVRLGLDMRCSLSKATSHAYRAGQGRFKTVLKHDDDKTLRVWRVA